jgi:hypothetical protein
MKIIPTTYEGIEYRSKTEAAWAAYLTYLGVNFEYEPEAFDLGSSGYYLPDFYLVDIDCFLEIKPTFILSGRESPVQSLANNTDKRVYLAKGQPRMFGDDCSDYIEVYFSEQGSDYPYWPCLCQFCGKFGIEFEGRSGRIKCCINNKGDKSYNSNDPRLNKAVKYALSVVKWRSVK